MKRRQTRAAVLLAALFSLVAIPAHAYLDPGTGSMILQVILGGFAAAGVALKLYWHRIKSFFGGGSTSDGVDVED